MKKKFLKEEKGTLSYKYGKWFIVKQGTDQFHRLPTIGPFDTKKEAQKYLINDHFIFYNLGSINLGWVFSSLDIRRFGDYSSDISFFAL